MTGPIHKKRRVRIDMLVPYLKVPLLWRVGRATFRPPGWLEQRLKRDVPQSSWADSLHRVLQSAEASEWSSASVVVYADAGRPVPGEEARELVRDAVALARLYQRACVPNFGLDHQTFGLPPDIDSTTMDHWVTGHGLFKGWGTTRMGVLGGFEFRKEWVRSFRSHPAFAYLDDALRGLTPAAGSWQQRGISAIRALNLGSPLRTQSIRIPLQAVALEALLGDDPTAIPGEFRSQAHPVAQRAAFLTCEIDGWKLATGKAACLDLWAASAREVETHPNYPPRPRNNFDWPCTAYWHIRQVFNDRNRAMHDAADDFSQGTAMRYEGRVDQVILAAMEWAAFTGAVNISDLDDTMAALPKAFITG